MQPRYTPDSVLRLAAAIACFFLVASCGGAAAASPLIEGCVPARDSEASVARLWNEALLAAIRRDFPAPTVHARNLFHVSAAMWDAWAAYDPSARGYFVDESLSSNHPESAREEAMSFAAHRVLTHRYEKAVGGDASLDDFDHVLASLCYDNEFVERGGDRPAAVGNRIAARIIEQGLNDGSLEEDAYEDSSYEAANHPLIVVLPGTEMLDPNRWQPLALEVNVSQGGQVQLQALQSYVGPHWGHVEAFALPRSEQGLPLDPGPPPRLGDPESSAAYKESAVEVIRYSAVLDSTLPRMIDMSPGALGNNRLGTNDGEGYAVNPVTNEVYRENFVALGDFGRVIAEFWADGPDSETPPGHWNTLANAVSEDERLARRIGGVGPEVSRLEWDVKMYFALNGALHDAAVAAWGSKAYYDYVRPISMTRYMGGLGQSSAASSPSYHPDGLPLVPDLIEVVSEASSVPGGRHQQLADHVGQVAVRAWAGNPGNDEDAVGGTAWILAIDWVPYQRETFVTPAFASYVSGHSTFSRAAAEVLTALTGSPYFPGGLGEWTVARDGLEFEAGPDTDVTLQWATYYDAADQAGISRLFGGIHIAADDFRGREMGSTCGIAAWELATQYFDGAVGLGSRSAIIPRS